MTLVVVGVGVALGGVVGAGKPMDPIPGAEKVGTGKKVGAIFAGVLGGAVAFVGGGFVATVVTSLALPLLGPTAPIIGLSIATTKAVFDALVIGSVAGGVTIGAVEAGKSIAKDMIAKEAKTSTR